MILDLTGRISVTLTRNCWLYMCFPFAHNNVLSILSSTFHLTPKPEQKKGSLRDQGQVGMNVLQTHSQLSLATGSVAGCPAPHAGKCPVSGMVIPNKMKARYQG